MTYGKSSNYVRDAHLQLAVYEGGEVQPYVAALSIDVPVQLYLLKEHCHAIGDDLDTSDMSAAQLEVVNKVCKEACHRLSSHQHVTGTEQDKQKHVQSVCFRPFLHEWITKHLAFVHKMINIKWLTDEKKRAARSDTQAILPEDHECELCGINLSRSGPGHAFICEHPLMKDLLLTRKSGKKEGLLAEVLSAETVRREVLEDAVHLPPSVFAAQAQAKEQEEKKQASSSSSDSSSASVASDSSDTSDDNGKQAHGRRGRGRGRGRVRGRGQDRVGGGHTGVRGRGQRRGASKRTPFKLFCRGSST